MKTILFVVISLLTSFFLYAQNTEITGILKNKKGNFLVKTYETEYIITENVGIDLSPFINKKVIIVFDTLSSKIESKLQTNLIDREVSKSIYKVKLYSITLNNDYTALTQNEADYLNQYLNNRSCENFKEGQKYIFTSGNYFSIITKYDFFKQIGYRVGGGQGLEGVTCYPLSEEEKEASEGCIGIISFYSKVILSERKRSSILDAVTKLK